MLDPNHIVTEESKVFLNSAGYIELTLQGILEGDLFGQIVEEVRQIAHEHGPINMFVDARQGRLGRDARSLSIILRMGRIPKLKTVLVLIDNPPTHPLGAVRSGIVISTFAAAIGFRPLYMENEAEARAKAVIR